MKRGVSHQKLLKTELKDRGLALAYLRESFGENNPRLFLIALRNVVNAQGGVSRLAEITKLGRQHLYKVLSEDGNPELTSLELILHALGFQLTVELKVKEGIKKAS